MFHQDKSQDVRKFVVGFVEEAWYVCLMLLVLLLSEIDTIFHEKASSQHFSYDYAWHQANVYQVFLLMKF